MSFEIFIDTQCTAPPKYCSEASSLAGRQGEEQLERELVDHRTPFENIVGYHSRSKDQVECFFS